MCSNINFYKCCIFVFWQDESSFSLNQKIDWGDIVTFKINVLIFRKEWWLQQRAYPCYKSRWSSLEAVDSLVCLLMNEQGNFKLQLVWKIRNKIIDIVFIFIEVIFYSLSQSLIEVQGQVVLFEDTVQDRDSLLKFGVCLIVVGEDRGERACGKWEGYNTNEHDHYRNCSF